MISPFHVIILISDQCSPLCLIILTKKHPTFLFALASPYIASNTTFASRHAIYFFLSFPIPLSFVNVLTKMCSAQATNILLLFLCVSMSITVLRHLPFQIKRVRILTKHSPIVFILYQKIYYQLLRQTFIFLQSARLVLAIVTVRQAEFSSVLQLHRIYFGFARQ